MTGRDIVWKGDIHTNSSTRQGIVPFVIVNHISAGSMESMDNWFTDPDNLVSSAHFGVARDGRIHQYVEIERAAWAQGIPPQRIAHAPAQVVRDMGINPNLYCVAIEHEGSAGELTSEQFEASVWLHRHIQSSIQEKWGRTIPLDDYHVIGHFQINPTGKPNCPGPKFPWNRLYDTLRGEDDNMPMKLEDWQWEMLYEVFGKAYNDDKIAWGWMQKIRDRTLTAAECAFLNTVLDGRIDRKIEV